jgi:glutamyl-tRNA reductase
MSFISPTKALFQQARVLLVGSGRMGHIRAKAIFANPRFDFAGVVDQNVDGAKQLADVYRVRYLGAYELAELIYFNYSFETSLFLIVYISFCTDESFCISH